MDENILRFRVGIFVVIAGCILGILVFLNGDLLTTQYTVYVNANEAPGVKKDTPIRRYGVLIGRVQDVKVNAEEGFVTLTLGINEGEIIYQNEELAIGYESILGDAGIEVIPVAKDEQKGARLKDQDSLPKESCNVKPDPFSMIIDMQPQIDKTFVVMQQAGASVEDASNKIGDFTSTLQDLFQDDAGDLKALLAEFRLTNQNAQAALQNFNRVFENLNEFVENPNFKSQLKQALNEFPRIVYGIRDLIDDTNEAVNEFRTIPDGVNASFDNIEKLTDQLRVQTPEVLAQINASLKNADDMIDQANQFTATLNKLDLENGSVGKLLSDPTIHDEILEIVRNVSETSARLEPLMRDLRMFADALARNPGAIVKGAIRKGGDAKYKGSVGGDGDYLR